MATSGIVKYGGGFLVALLGIGVIVSIFSPADQNRTDAPQTAAPAGSANKEDPSLNASILFSAVEMNIENEDSFDWTDCDLEINPHGEGGFSRSVARVKQHTAVTLALDEFADSEGLKFDSLSHAITRFHMSCTTPSGRMSYFGTRQAKTGTD